MNLTDLSTKNSSTKNSPTKNSLHDTEQKVRLPLKHDSSASVETAATATIAAVEPDHDPKELAPPVKDNHKGPSLNAWIFAAVGAVALLIGLSLFSFYRTSRGSDDTLQKEAVEQETIDPKAAEQAN